MRDKINDRKECGSCEFTLDKICNALPSHLYGAQFISLSLLRFSLSSPLSLSENITRSPEFLRKYAYWKCPSTSSVRPFHFNRRIDVSAAGRFAQIANLKALFQRYGRYDHVCISASSPFTCDYSGAVLLEICGKRQAGR